MTAISDLYDLTEDMLDLGGSSSGNWGHAGRPGKIGGSAPGAGHKALAARMGGQQALDLLKEDPTFAEDLVRQRRYTRTSGPGPSVDNATRKKRLAEVGDLPASYVPAKTDQLTRNYSPEDYSDVDAVRISISKVAALYAHLQGFDGPPAVVDKKEMDRLITTGQCVELHRGLEECPSGTSQYLCDQFRSGPCFYGKGMYGNGIYTSTALSPATVQQGDYPSNVGIARYFANGGSVLRMALSKKARVWEYTKKIGDTNMEDFGQWAIRKGYDAMHIACGKEDGSNDYFVIFNRTAVYVQDVDVF